MHWMLMPLRRYADFQGRSRRQEYWMYALLQVIVYFVFLVLAAMLVTGGGAVPLTGDPFPTAGIGFLPSVLYGLWWLGTLIPGLAVAIRRLHDTNRTGWWILGPIVPYILAFVLAFGAIIGAGGTDPSGGGIIAGGIAAIILLLAALGMAVVIFVFTVLEGTRGPNRFGQDPKQPLYADTFA